MAIEGGVGSDSGWSSAEKLSDGGWSSNGAGIGTGRSDSEPISILLNDRYTGVPFDGNYASVGILFLHVSVCTHLST